MFAVISFVVAGRFAPGHNAADHSLVAPCEAPHNKRMQQTIPPANKFASGLAPDPQRYQQIFKENLDSYELLCY